MSETEVPIEEPFMDCDHVFEDITEERHRLIEERGGLPSWVKYLMEKDPREAIKWGGEAYKSSKFEKCKSCGLLRIVDQRDMK